jgi:hypothetical protein
MYARRITLQKSSAARLIEPARSRAYVWDRVGIGISGVCMVHCLLLPVLLATLPLWPLAEALHGGLHVAFAVLLVPTTLLAGRSGYRKHRQRGVLVLLVGGLVVVIAASVLGHEMPGAFAETSLTLLGSGLLVGGHWRNRRLAGACTVPVHRP